MCVWGFLIIYLGYSQHILGSTDNMDSYAVKPTTNQPT